jgi:cell division protein ZapA (FtsZ GTPase activity inhibitor)
MINEKINNYMQTFTTADKQDALAMCAIEVASDLSSLQNQHQLAEAAILQEINQISQVLTA